MVETDLSFVPLSMMERYETVESLSYEDFGLFLEAEGIHASVISTFTANRICGKINQRRFEGTGTTDRR